MKSFVLLLSISLSAFAIDEIECMGRTAARQHVEVELDWSFGTFRDGRVRVMTDGDWNTTEVRVWSVPTGRPQRLHFTGQPNFRLEIDLFPDLEPRWGRIYRADLAMRGLERVRVNCRFPRATP